MYYIYNSLFLAYLDYLEEIPRCQIPSGQEMLMRNVHVCIIYTVTYDKKVILIIFLRFDQTELRAQIFDHAIYLTLCMSLVY